jgi:hypothetical protein
MKGPWALGLGMYIDSVLVVYSVDVKALLQLGSLLYIPCL